MSLGITLTPLEKTIIKYFVYIFLGFFVHVQNIIYFRRRLNKFKEFTKFYKQDTTTCFSLKVFLLSLYAGSLFYKAIHFMIFYFKGAYEDEDIVFLTSFCVLCVFCGFCLLYTISALKIEWSRKLKPSFDQMKRLNFFLILMQILFLIVPRFICVPAFENTPFVCMIFAKIIINVTLLISYFCQEEDPQDETTVTQPLSVIHHSETIPLAQDRLFVVINSFVQKKLIVRTYDAKHDLVSETHKSSKEVKEFLTKVYELFYTSDLRQILTSDFKSFDEISFSESSLNKLLEIPLYRLEMLADFLEIRNRDARKKYFVSTIKKSLVITEIVSKHPSIRYRKNFRNMRDLVPVCWIMLDDSDTEQTGQLLVAVQFKADANSFNVPFKDLCSVLKSCENRYQLFKSNGSIKAMEINLSILLNEPLYEIKDLVECSSHFDIDKTHRHSSLDQCQLYVEINENENHTFLTKYNSVVIRSKINKNDRIIFHRKVERDLKDYLILLEHLKIRKNNDPSFADIKLPLISFSNKLAIDDIAQLLNDLLTRQAALEILELRLFLEIENVA